MSKVIMVLCDGLRYNTAVEMMGYMELMVEKQLASRYYIQGEMPTISRPMYETIHTGTPVNIHGITSNWVVRPSNMPNIFSIARENGKKTAASANFWFSELYNGCPYISGQDKECDDPALNIQYGRFYTTDAMPDEEIFNSGQSLLRKYHPDYLLIHPIGMDTLGHIHGPESNQYRNTAMLIDMFLATYVPGWLDEGYTVFVTADHGMSRNNSHNGSLPESRDIPLYLIQPQKPVAKILENNQSMLSIAPTVLKIMGLPVPATMKQSPLV
jgi:predicted AlkP superfamily pyrophosphatase or phosphodiesterase